MKRLSEGHTPEDRRRAYEDFYRRGGWAHSRPAQLAFMRHVAERAGWKPDSHVVELGCGMGLHASVLAQLGMSVVALDASDTGIEAATMDHGRATPRTPRPPTYVCTDATTWEPSRPCDGIFCRGMSLYHYELAGVNLHGYDVAAATSRFFDWLEPGGVFVLQIATRFTGERPKGWIHHPRLSEYRDLFQPLGDVFATTDWRHRPLDDDDDARANGHTGVIVYTRKRRG